MGKGIKEILGVGEGGKAYANHLQWTEGSHKDFMTLLKWGTGREGLETLYPVNPSPPFLNGTAITISLFWYQK